LIAIINFSIANYRN